MLKLSNSRLEALDRCPRFFFLAYIAGLPTPDSSPARVGSACHQIAEESLLHMVEQRIDGDIEFTEARARAVTQGLADHERDDVIELMGCWADRFRFNPDEIGGVELEMAANWDGEVIDLKGRRIKDVDGFRAKLDLVLVKLLPDGRTKLEIIDWKFGWVPPRTKSLGSDHQLQRYGWLALQEYPEVDEIEVALEYVRLGRRYPPENKPLILDPQRLRDETWGHIQEQRDRITMMLGDCGDWREEKGWEGVFKPTSGMQCQFCNFDCPLKGTPAECITPTNDAEAAKLAQEIVVYESAASDRMHRLQFYLDNTPGHHRLEAAGRFWSTESKQHEVWDWAAVQTAAKKMGLDLSSLLREPTDAQVTKFLNRREMNVLKELAQTMGAGPHTKYSDPSFSGRITRPDGWQEGGTDDSTH